MQDPRAADRLSVTDLIILLWRQKVIIVAITVIAALIGVGVVMGTKPIYRARVTALSVDIDARRGALSGLAGQLGGLAALAGISTGSNSRKAEAVALLKSQRIIEEFIDDNNLLPVLFPDKWDSAKKTWAVPRDEVPTLQDAYRFFDRAIRRVAEDPATGIVTLEILWGDRHLAAAWANEIVSRVNEAMRKQTVEESQSSVTYLETQLEETSAVELRRVLYTVMQDHITAMTLANARIEFGLRVIDPAVPSTENHYVRPRRRLIVLSGLLGGFMLGALIGLIRARVI